MEDIKYFITQEQLKHLNHNARMFELNASNIYDLCSFEKHDIVYGFELGKIHSNLKEHYLDMTELSASIANQKLED